MGLNWNLILTEINHQLEISGRNVWITWIGERLDLLEEKGVNIPIMKEIDFLREKFHEELEKKFSK